jgi:hypothetical protein
VPEAVGFLYCKDRERERERERENERMIWIMVLNNFFKLFVNSLKRENN